ncbi:MAG: peptidase M20, partial [Acidobacteria bacterium]
MPARSAAPPHAPRQAQGSRLSENARVRAALDWFTPNISWINDQQARITEIPAPPFQEAQRAGAVKELLADSGLATQIDKTGNVIGELRGVNEKEIVVVAAHLDTV